MELCLQTPRACAPYRGAELHKRSAEASRVEGAALPAKTAPQGEDASGLAMGQKAYALRQTRISNRAVSVFVEIYRALDFKGPAEALATADGFTVEKHVATAFGR